MVSYFSEAFETLNRATAAGNAHGSGKACRNLKGVPDSKYRWASSRPTGGSALSWLCNSSEAQFVERKLEALRNES